MTLWWAPSCVWELGAFRAPRHRTEAQAEPWKAASAGEAQGKEVMGRERGQEREERQTPKRRGPWQPGPEGTAVGRQGAGRHTA